MHGIFHVITDRRCDASGRFRSFCRKTKESNNYVPSLPLFASLSVSPLWEGVSINAARLSAPKRNVKRRVKCAMSFGFFLRLRAVCTHSTQARTHLAISLSHSIVTQSTFCFNEQGMDEAWGGSGTGWVIERIAATLFFCFIAATDTLSLRLTASWVYYMQ